MHRSTFLRRNASLLLLSLVVTGSFGCAAGASTKKKSSVASPPKVITIKDFVFTPEKLTARVGRPITIINSDRIAHTVTADDKTFDTSKMLGGAKKTITIAKAGTYKFHCDIHDYMTGTITVK